MKIPILSQTNAILLATIIFKVKFQSKILRSKENTLSKEIIEGCLDQAIPYYMKLTMADTLWADSGKTSGRELDVGRGGGRGGWQWTWGRSTNGMICVCTTYGRHARQTETCYSSVSRNDGDGNMFQETCFRFHPRYTSIQGRTETETCFQEICFRFHQARLAGFFRQYLVDILNGGNAQISHNQISTKYHPKPPKT